MNKKIISIDQGTTSSRAVLFDQNGSLLSSEQREITQYFPQDGWVEHDPEEIWSSVFKTSRDLIKKNNLNVKDIASIGITNQRETSIIWDRKTGNPIYPAIVWQDRRTSDICDRFRSSGVEQEVQIKSGLLLDPYFSATKISWILDNVVGAREKAEKGDLAFGTVDCFLVWRLTEGREHKTDVTNASRTMLFNILENRWDQSLLELFNIPKQILPEVCDNIHDYGFTSLFGGNINIGGVAGDQQAALIGQCCVNSGEAKTTYGTGCFLLLNTGSERINSQNKLLSTICYRINGQTTYGLEGSIFIAGSAVQWLRDRLNFFDSAEKTEELAKFSKEDSNVLVVPAFTGLGAPHWDAEARGAIYGLTLDSSIPEITAATLKSIAFQTKDLLWAIAKDGAKLDEMRVDGGMVSNSWFVEQLSNILNITVLRPKIIETTALGASFLAGINAGLFSDINSLDSIWSCDKTFIPEEGAVKKLADQYNSWSKAVKLTKDLS